MTAGDRSILAARTSQNYYEAISAAYIGMDAAIRAAYEYDNCMCRTSAIMEAERVCMAALDGALYALKKAICDA